MNDDRDADLRYMALVLPLAILFCLAVWAGAVWVITRFAS